MDALKQAFACAGIGLAAAPIWGAFIWELWEAGIRPRRIPAAEINALAATMLAQYGDKAGDMAFITEDRAWRYSDGFEQGRWRRVRKVAHGQIAEKLTIPYKRPIKPVYIRKLVAFIDAVRKQQ